MIVQSGTYRHNKSGSLYAVIGTALQTETEQELVIYKPLYQSRHQLFARPLDMFSEMVVVDGQSKPRFERVDD